MISKGKIRVLTFGTPTKEVENMGISVKPLGYIRGDNKLANVYSAADLYILPSLEDNLPNNMLESMSCGTPVVGFQAGGIPDMIQDDYTGYLAPFCNEKKMAEKILKLVFDENIRRRMSQNCRSLIEKKFALDVQANNYQELFVDLLAEKNFVPSQSKYSIEQKEISIEKCLTKKSEH